MQNNVINLEALLKNINPVLNKGEFVFCSINDLALINLDDIQMMFREKEGCTIILTKDIAESLNLSYDYIAAWITLSVNSSLSATGFTATFSKALSENGISCNVVAAYYHDHIFVTKKDGLKAIQILKKLSKLHNE